MIWEKTAAHVWQVRRGRPGQPCPPVVLWHLPDDSPGIPPGEPKRWNAEVRGGGPLVTAPTADHALLALAHHCYTLYRMLGTLGLGIREHMIALVTLDLPTDIRPARPDQAWAIYSSRRIGGLLPNGARIVLDKNDIGVWDSYIHRAGLPYGGAVASAPAELLKRTIRALKECRVSPAVEDGRRSIELAELLEAMPPLPEEAYKL